jgi:serine/threonine protein kinase/formylglycine-generating enzyme required for sulfatase activity
MSTEELIEPRDDVIRQIVEDAIDRRALGERLTDDDLVARHPHLLPDLGEALRKLRVVQRGQSRARELTELEQELARPQRERDDFPGYEVLRHLGAGGQSRVLLARSVVTGDLVAIKVLLDAALHDEAREQRLRQEAAILAGLRHRCIVPVVDSGTSAAGLGYFVMPYIEGDDLNPADLAERLDGERRLRLFIQICRAVDCAHRAGVVHRDLKPANIRIDAAGQPHVLDFGLASVAIARDTTFNSMTTTGQFVGTFMWSSPEQFKVDAEITAASDVYSLGVILHQLLCEGRFPAQVFHNLQRQVGTATPRRVRWELETPLARACGPVLSKSLDEDPARRFATAGQLGDAVVSAIARAGVRRRLGKVSVVLGSLALISAIAWGAFYLGRSRGEAHVVEVNGRPLLDSLPGGAFVYCPPGEFTAGWRRTPGRDNQPPDEAPRRMTIAKGFYLQVFEVNQATYEALMGTNPSRFKDPENPVECVSYDDAVEYCRRLSARVGRTCRLPTEWEWEYACRAGTDTVFSFGDEPTLCIKYGNVLDQSNRTAAADGRLPYNDGAPFTSHVSSVFNSNTWKLYEMHGNVWEWCAAPYLIDPTDAASAIPNVAPLRGGSWYDPPLPASHRNPIVKETREPTVGFRVLIEDNATR